MKIQIDDWACNQIKTINNIKSWKLRHSSGFSVRVNFEHSPKRNLVFGIITPLTPCCERVYGIKMPQDLGCTNCDSMQYTAPYFEKLHCAFDTEGFFKRNILEQWAQIQLDPVESVLIIDSLLDMIMNQNFFKIKT